MGFLGRLIRPRKATDNYAIALDIGTEFVKALIFKVEDEKGLVKGVGRQRQALTHMQGGAVTDIHGVIKNCESALSQAIDQCSVQPEQVIIGIAGELVKGTTTIIRYTRPYPKSHITMGELKDIIARVQRRAFDRARSVLAWETGHSEIDVRLVNAAIVDVRIDGYRVTNPLGFQGKEVQVSIFNAFAPIVHLGALQTIAQELDLDLISIAAEPYAVARSFKSEENLEYSAVFMDIGGGTTDIAVVDNGGVVGTKMFAFGGRTFTKRVGTYLGQGFSKAEEKKILYSAGNLPKKEMEGIHQALMSDCQLWFSGVELTLAEFSNVELLPHRILLCGGGSNLPDIAETLKSAKWSKKLPFSRRPTVHFMKPNDVKDIIDETGLLKGPEDVTPMSLAYLSLELVGQAGVVDGILGSVVRSLRT